MQKIIKTKQELINEVDWDSSLDGQRLDEEQYIDYSLFIERRCEYFKHKKEQIEKSNDLIEDFPYGEEMERLNEEQEIIEEFLCYCLRNKKR